MKKFVEKSSTALTLSLHFTRAVFRQPRPFPEGALSSQLHCILQTGTGIERQLHCLRILLSSRQVDCACKNRQLKNLTVLIKSLLRLNFITIFLTCIAFVSPVPVSTAMVTRSVEAVATPVSHTPFTARSFATFSIGIEIAFCKY